MLSYRIVLPLLFLAAPLAAQPPKFGVSPQSFELRLDGSERATHSFRVFNYDDRPIDVAIEVHTWDLDEANEVRVLPPDEQSLDQWIVINPVRFTIPAEGTQVVRFSVRPRVEPEPGEHRALVYLTTLPTADKPSGVSFNFRWGMAIYGYVGEITRTGTLHGVDVGAAGASFDVASQGTAFAQLDGQYAVWRAAAFPSATGLGGALAEGEVEGAWPEGVVRAGKLPGRAVLPGTRRRLPLAIEPPLPPGDYVFDVHGHLGEAVVDLTVPFSVAALPASPAPE